MDLFQQRETVAHGVVTQVRVKTRESTPNRQTNPGKHRQASKSPNNWQQVKILGKQSEALNQVMKHTATKVKRGMKSLYIYKN